MGEADTMNNLVFIFKTHRAMPQLKEWGTIELNPIMWLTIWRPYIDQFVMGKYKAEGNTKHKLPLDTWKYQKREDDVSSPAKKNKS